MSILHLAFDGVALVGRFLTGMVAVISYQVLYEVNQWAWEHWLLGV